MILLFFFLAIVSILLITTWTDTNFNHIALVTLPRPDFLLENDTIDTHLWKEFSFFDETGEIKTYDGALSIPFLSTNSVDSVFVYNGLIYGIMILLAIPLSIYATLLLVMFWLISLFSMHRKVSWGKSYGLILSIVFVLSLFTGLRVSFLLYSLLYITIIIFYFKKYRPVLKSIEK